jgi:hypothetical protein
MIPIAEDLNVGEWVDVSKPYHKRAKQKYFELRLKDINKCVGKAQLSEYGGSVVALFSTENDGEHQTIPPKTKLTEINLIWEHLMNKLLKKMFK